MSKEIVYLHFYLADKTDDAHLDDLIAGWTKIFNRGTPPLSHVEKQNGQFCFSATLRDESKGVRYALASEVLKHPDRWITLVNSFTLGEIDRMTRRERSILGRPYFKSGIVLHFLLPFGKLGDWIGKWLDHWYCSMACYYALLNPRMRISPRRLYKWALANGWVETETPEF